MPIEHPSKVHNKNDEVKGFRKICFKKEYALGNTFQFLIFAIFRGTLSEIML